MTTLIATIARHDAIGWDFDQTLIDNPRSREFLDLITRTPEKRHVIVTFRTGGLLERIWADLMGFCRVNGIEFDPIAIDDIHAIDDGRWAEWARLQAARTEGRLGGPLLPAEDYYRTWKGMVCKQAELTVLVDDDKINTETGCAKHGIEFVHSLG